MNLLEIRNDETYQEVLRSFGYPVEHMIHKWQQLGKKDLSRRAHCNTLETYATDQLIAGLQRNGALVRRIRLDPQVHERWKNLPLPLTFAHNYLTYLDIEREMQFLQRLHPEHCELVAFADPEHKTSGIKSSDTSNPINHQQTIKLLRVSGDLEAKDRPALLVVAGTHGDEPLNPLVALEFAQLLLQQYGSHREVTQLLDQLEILVLPVLNPDGLNFQLRNTLGNRKNCNPVPEDPLIDSNPVGIYGVDINRNFCYRWNGTPDSQDDKCLPTGAQYPGPHSMSEAENRCLEYIVAQRFPNIRVAVDMHSNSNHGNCVHFPGRCFFVREPEEESSTLIDVYQQLAVSFLAGLNHRDIPEVMTGLPDHRKWPTYHEDHGGPVHGSSHIHLWFEHGIFTFLLESQTGFRPDLTDTTCISDRFYRIIGGLLELGRATVQLRDNSNQPFKAN